MTIKDGLDTRSIIKLKIYDKLNYFKDVFNIQNINLKKNQNQNFLFYVKYNFYSSHFSVKMIKKVVKLIDIECFIVRYLLYRKT